MFANIGISDNVRHCEFMPSIPQRAITVPLCLVLSCLGILSGCGAGGDDNSPSKPVFIRQGDAICQHAESEKEVKIESFLRKAGIGSGRSLSAKQNEEMVSTAILPPIRKLGEGLEDLGVPDEKEAMRIVEQLMRVVEELEDEPSRLTENAAGDPFADVAKDARVYGFKTCILYY